MAYRIARALPERGVWSPAAGVSGIERHLGAVLPASRMAKSWQFGPASQPGKNVLNFDMDTNTHLSMAATRSGRFAGRLYSLLLAALISCAALAGQQASPLLFSEQPLAVTLVADFDQLLMRRNWSTERWFDGRIELQDQNGVQRSLAVRLKARGGFRTRDRTCYFPQLFVDVSDADTEGTVFAGRRILPLVTHCRGASSYSGYIYREYLAYRIYNLLTEKSLRVQAALVTYINEEKKSAVIAKRYAFFVEHFDDLAARLQASRVEPEVFLPVSADGFEMGVMDLFQFMVGNTDWSAAFRHNILLLQQEGRPVFAVPYDFDFSGLVNAKYATPAKMFRTSSVRTRIYRGHCRDDFDEQIVADYFQNRRPEIFALIKSIDWIPPSVQQDSASYIESFYAVLDSPVKFQKQVIQQCGRGMPVPEK